MSKLTREFGDSAENRKLLIKSLQLMVADTRDGIGPEQRATLEALEQAGNAAYVKKFEAAARSAAPHAKTATPGM